MSNFFDRCGMTVSGLCSVHCVGLVMLSLIQPLAAWLSQAVPQLRVIEIIFALSATVFALVAFVSGYRHHGHAAPVGLGAAGLTLLVLAVLSPLHETPWAPWVSLAGGASLIIAHRWNIRCRCAHQLKAQA